MGGRWKRQGIPIIVALAGLVLVLYYQTSDLGTAGSSNPTATATADRSSVAGLVGVTGTATAIPSATQTVTLSPTPSSTATWTPTATPTWTPSPTHTPTPTVTPPNMVPSRTPTAALPPEATATLVSTEAAVPTVTTGASATLVTVEPSPTITPSATPLPSPTMLPSPTPLPSATPYIAGLMDSTIPYGERFGVTSGTSDMATSHAAGLPFGSVLNWKINPNPPVPAGVNFWQVVRVRETGPERPWAEIEAVVLAQPGSIWTVGNEPDVRWQDNVTPEGYARVYHDVYTFIKNLDGTARVAIGGVSQATPLRRAYLDRVLDSYQAEYGVAMPIDIWTVHGFILREELDSWGVGIPPGMSDEGAIRYEVEDHGNVAIFQQNIIDFRVWLGERGYGDRPLAVTEYGILLPSDYGFPPEVVADFMVGSFDFFLNTAGESGYQPDGGRLVQWWFWYAVYDYDEFPTGSLFHRPTGQLTWLGGIYANYVNGH